MTTPERNAPSEARQEMEIRQYFQKADRAFRNDPEALHEPMYKYLDEVGKVNFAELERVFRKYEFNAYFLSIPAAMVESQNPQILVGDINDMYFDGKITPRPFVAIAYPGMQAVIKAAKDHGMLYSMDKNMKRLAVAGAYVPNPAYSGPLSPLLITVQKRSFGTFAHPN